MRPNNPSVDVLVQMNPESPCPLFNRKYTLFLKIERNLMGEKGFNASFAALTDALDPTKDDMNFNATRRSILAFGIILAGLLFVIDPDKVGSSGKIT
jgi:hypothetical protein